VLVKQLGAVGWTSRSEADGVSLEGPEGVAIRVVPGSASRRGISEVMFSLQAPAEAGTARFGTIALHFEKDRARIVFVP
jgi:hypothetical protein